MNDKLIYHQEKPSKEIQRAIDWINSGSTVLELGCHTGVLAAEIKKKSCVVTGVEVNQQALKIAEPHLSKSFCRDLNDFTFWNELNNEKFDAITWIHVLEHLFNPEETLIKSAGLLKEDGVMIIALPNISNARQRFDMLFGKFEYEETGVMDKTHLHFFNYFTAPKLIESCGLKITEYYSAWQTNPTRQFLRHLPVLHNLTRVMSESKPPLFPGYAPNLTDVTMLFKCVRK